MFSCFLMFKFKSSQVIGYERAKETKSVKHESLPRRNMFKFRSEEHILCEPAETV